MRITACLLALLCAGPAAFAQAPIGWSPERRLAKDDFKGRVALNAPSASMSWIQIDTEWTCEKGGLVATARAMFDPSQSWWRGPRGNVWGGPGERVSSAQAQQDARRSVLELDMQLLDHEQIHFDIAEVAARKIRARFAEYKNADVCAEPGGTEPIQRMVADVDRELQEEQQRYDRETGHGTNARAQDQWKRKVRALLN